MAVSNSSGEIHSPEIQFALDAVLYACRDKGKWKTGLTFVKSLYLRGGFAHYPFQREESTMPKDIAAQISGEPGDFPLPLVAIADSQLHSAAGATASKLLDVANREGWFQQ
jgi:hypothetical protein